MKLSAIAFLSCLALPNAALGVLPRAPLLSLPSEHGSYGEAMDLLETSSGAAPENPSQNTPVQDPMTLPDNSNNQQQQQQQQGKGDTAPLPAADAAAATGPGTDAPVDQNALPASAVKAQAEAQAKAQAEAKAKAQAEAEAKIKAEEAAKKAQAEAQAKAKAAKAKAAKAKAEQDVKKAEDLANAGDNGAAAAAAAAAAASADSGSAATGGAPAAPKESLTDEPIAAPYDTHPSFSALSAPSTGATTMPAWYTMTLMGQAALTGGLSDGHAHSRATHLAHASASGAAASNVVRVQPRAPLDPAFLHSALMATHLAVRARATHPGNIPMGIESAQQHELTRMQQMRAWQQQQQQQMPGMAGFPPAAAAAYGNPQMMAGMPPMYGAAAMQQPPQQPFQPFQQFRPQQQMGGEPSSAMGMNTAERDVNPGRVAGHHHNQGFNGMKDSFVSKLEVATKRHADHEGRVSRLSKDLRSLSSDPEDSF